MDQDPEVAAILSREPDPERPYLYRGTNVRINKFGILNPYALDLVVRATSGLRAEILRTKPVAGNFDLEHLCAIHRFLFQDVYPWAGDLRVVDFDRSQDPYTHPRNILAESTKLFAELAGENYLRGLEHGRFTERLTYYIHRLYMIHPFRDGNGRSVRGFLEQLASACGFRFDLGSIRQKERHSSARAAHQGDMAPLSELIRRVTTPLSDGAKS
jgi:cell filamentation protein